MDNLVVVLPGKTLSFEIRDVSASGSPQDPRRSPRRVLLVIHVSWSASARFGMPRTAKIFSTNSTARKPDSCV